MARRVHGELDDSNSSRRRWAFAHLAHGDGERDAHARASLGWTHEFGDASQSLNASLVGVPGSSFSATGITFGRDAALVGAGFSMEVSPNAKVFVDYDGKFSQRLQEHSISGGLRVKF